MNKLPERVVWSIVSFIVLIIFRVSDYFPSLFYPFTASFWFLIIFSIVSVITLFYNLLISLFNVVKKGKSMVQFLMNLVMIIIIFLVFWISA